jgi:prephenate dehydrogenase
MSASKPRITIVGLGQVGGSIGLALRQAEVASEVIGHDLARAAGDQAKKTGAVDRIHWNLISACEESDLIILSTPVGAIEETLEAIGPYLRPDCVVVDTASLKAPVMAWAAKHLPPQVHFVGGDPIPGTPARGHGGLDAARADLFQGGLFCLMPSATAGPDSVKLAAELAAVLGAKPLFLDAEEHDGLLAAVEHLPALLALTTMQTMITQPAWRELRKVAGPAFETSTDLVSAQAVTQSDLYLLNKDNLLRWIDAFSASLQSIRELLAQDESEELAERFTGAAQERGRWMADRSEGEWLEGPRTEMPERPSMVDTFLGTFWRRKPREEA